MTAKKSKFHDEWVDDLVRRHKLAKPEELAAIRHHAENDQSHILDAIVDHNLIDERELYLHIAQDFNLQLLQPKPGDVNKTLLVNLGEKLCRQRLLVPLTETDDVVKVLTANPMDLELQNDLKFRFGKKINLFLGTRRTIGLILDFHFNAEPTNLDSKDIFITDVNLDIIGMSNKGLGVDPEISKAPIIRVTKHVIAAAIRQKAEYVHLEPGNKTTKIYFESDGVKKTVAEYPLKTGDLIINRAKYLAGLALERKSGPQNGRCRVTSHLTSITQNFELRISVLPSSFGEKAVLSLRDKNEVVLPLDSLGMLPQVKTYVEKLLEQPSGLVLFVSPPAMGKTTTMYSCLQHFVKQKRSVFTVENPIHFVMEDMTQLEMDANVGNTGAVLIRSMMKQSPNVLMVDDIQDGLTAEAVVRAAESKTLAIAAMDGHMAVEAVIHLINLGVSRKLIAATLKAVVLQRLVNRICPHCKEQIATPALNVDLTEVMKKRGLLPRFFKGKGCSHCNNSGYLGQLGVYEVFPVTPEYGEAIANGSSEADLKMTAKQIGIRSLFDYGLAHIALGHTTVEEIGKFIDFGRIVVAEPRIEAVTSAQITVKAHPEFVNRLVLVAEDNASVRSVIKSTLVLNQFRVAEARDGRQTIELLKQARPDILLLDMNMPYISGIDILKQIRMHPALQTLPVIVLTAASQAQMEFEALENGADDYILKPFRPELLTARIRAVLRRYDLARTQEPLALAA